MYWAVVEEKEERYMRIYIYKSELENMLQSCTMEPILCGWMKPRNHARQGNIQNMVRHSTDAHNRHLRHGTEEVTSENFIVCTDVLQKPQFEDVTFSPLFTLRPERFSILISRYTVPTRLKFEKIGFS